MLLHNIFQGYPNLDYKYYLMDGFKDYLEIFPETFFKA